MMSFAELLPVLPSPVSQLLWQTPSVVVKQVRPAHVWHISGVGAGVQELRLLVYRE